MLAYAHLNLRWNPFSEVSEEDVATLAVVHVEQYVDRLKVPGFVVQFLGDPGRGKTTHLLALREFFPQAPYFHFAEHAPIPEIPDAPLLFLDETQRLPASLRKRTFSRQASFVIATHKDHASELKKSGKEYDSVYIQGLTVSKLKQILERRIEWARRDAGPVPTIPDPAVVRLIQLYGDDLNAILSGLYEEFQSMQEVSDVKISGQDSIQ